jgi:bifunctional isochorismate lyase/aryl carrier protein
MSLTRERMRADIAKAIGIDASEIGDDDHLPDLGLDSVRMMQVILGWEEAGLAADFSVFAEYATLGEWWREVETIQAGA